MEDIVFEKDYTELKRSAKTEQAVSLYEQAISGGSLKAFADAMAKIPKVIVPEDKRNYEYLLDKLDAMAKRKNGRIKGVVDYHTWESHIEVFLPFLGFEGPEELQLMKEISEKAHSVNVTSYEDGVRLYVMINYFEELMSDEHKAYLKYDAIMQDEELAVMLGMPEIDPDQKFWVDRLKAILDRFDEETEFDRTTVFMALLDKMAKEPENKQSLEHMTIMAEALLEKVLNGEAE